MHILELISNRPSTFIELVELMNSNKTTIYRFLTTLETLGYIKKNEDHRYYLTSKFHSIGMNNYFIESIKPYLKKLAHDVKESIVIATYSNNQVYYLEKIESPLAHRIVVTPGESAPLYCVASGKLFLAHLTDEELEKYFKKVQLRAITGNTITSKEQLINEIKKIRKQGFAVDHEEWQPYLRGVAFPIYNHSKQMIASLAIAGVSYRLTEEKLTTVVPKGLKTAELISNLLRIFKRS